MQHGELDILRRKLFAVRHHQNILDAAADVDLRIADLGHVAGMQPPVLVDRGSRCLLVVPIAQHHVAATREQLCGFAELYLDTRQRRPDRFGIVVPHVVNRYHRRRLGHPVALEQREPEPDEGMRDLRIERGTADDGEPHLPTKSSEHGFSHDGAQQRRCQRVKPAGAFALDAPAAGDALPEEPALRGRLRQGLVDARVELFEDARYREHDGRCLRRQIFRKLSRASRVHDLGANR